MEHLGQYERLSSWPVSTLPHAGGCSTQGTLPASWQAAPKSEQLRCTVAKHSQAGRPTSWILPLRRRQLACIGPFFTPSGPGPDCLRSASTASEE